MKFKRLSLPAVFLLAALLAHPSAAEDGTLPHEHDWQFSGHVNYTCSEEGYDLYVCAGCGEEERRHIEPASHRDETVSATRPDCENEGREVRRCTVCGNETVITTPALGHDWGEGTVEKEPTLITEGRMKLVCKRDPSHIKYEKIPPLASSSSDDSTALYLIAASSALSLLAAFILTAVRKRKT